MGVQYRPDFPMLTKRSNGHPLIYLDSAATAHKPASVIEAVASCYQDHYATVHRAVYGIAVESTATYHKVRQKVHRLLNSRYDEEIIFTRGTTDGINLVAHSFGRRYVAPGDEIIITELEHHSNIVPWQLMCEERGAHLRVIPATESGDLDLEVYANLLSDRTRVVAVGHISNAIGTVHPIQRMAEMAHDAGSAILVDGAQAVSHLPVDVQQLGVDFYLFSSHKIYGPTGVGILYGRRELLEEMPPYQGGGDMIESVSFEKTTFNQLPFKFEAGTPPIAQVAGLGAAIDYLQEIGLDKIGAYEQELLTHLLHGLECIQGVRLIGSPEFRGSLVSFIVDGVHAFDLGTLLDLRGICVRTGHLCAQPAMKRYGVAAFVRVSLGLYNTVEEIDRFLEALEEIINQLR
jgi:cysteine desulfurase / selenocysteine lyase